MEQKMQYSEPGYYSISFVGEIQPEIIQIIMNFYSGKIRWEKKDKNTFLEGMIKDQVALSGLLNYLTDLHYILLSVKKHEKELSNKTIPKPK